MHVWSLKTKVWAELYSLLSLSAGTFCRCEIPWAVPVTVSYSLTSGLQLLFHSSSEQTEPVPRPRVYFPIALGAGITQDPGGHLKAN